MKHLASPPWALAAFLCLGACGASTSDEAGPADDAVSPGSRGGRAPGAPTAAPGTPGAPDSPAGAPETSAPPPAAAMFATSPGLRRLTRAEYTHAVADLLGVPVLSDDLPDQQLIEGHSAIAGAQKIGYDDHNRYLDMAERVASVAAPKLAMEVACADAACQRPWVVAFLTKAFRGPPANVLVDRYAALLASAEAGSTPAERVTAFLEAVLTSPHFLYRKEIGTGSGPTRVLLPYEVATRLSFLLWQSGPDAELLTVAGRGDLAQPAGRLLQVNRMLKDPRSARALRSFVGDWMGLFEKELGKKAPEVLAGLGSDFPEVAQKGFDLLLDDALGASETARFSQLLSLDYAFANSTLAKIMGATASGSSFAKVMLKTSERRGILTHPLVLGTHSKESGASPFPLGKFIFENILCEVIPPPPAMFAPVEDATNADQTLRQKLEALTSPAVCANCHDRIGPAGFAFLPFDAVGRYKNKDARGMPFDTRGTLKLPGGATPVAFDGASDLVNKLAQSAAISGCVARRMFRWTYGRYEGPEDRATLDDLEQASVMTGTAVAPLLRKLAGAPAFAQVHIR